MSLSNVNVTSQPVDYVHNVNFFTFSRTHKVGNNGIIANFIFPHSCSFLHYLYFKVLVNVKLDDSW